MYNIHCRQWTLHLRLYCGNSYSNFFWCKCSVRLFVSVFFLVSLIICDCPWDEINFYNDADKCSIGHFPTKRRTYPERSAFGSARHVSRTTSRDVLEDVWRRTFYTCMSGDVLGDMQYRTFLTNTSHDVLEGVQYRTFYTSPSRDKVRSPERACGLFSWLNWV